MLVAAVVLRSTRSCRNGCGARPPLPLVLQASAHTSRFEESDYTTVDPHGVAVTVGSGDGAGTTRKLLVDTFLRLTAGTRDAFLGRNGTGKAKGA